VKTDISRRNFLAIFGGLLSVFAGFNLYRLWRRDPPIKLIGPSAERGHAIRAPFIAPSIANSNDVDIAIIGGGISGMSAGWYLQKHGHKGFQLFELEDRAAGNAQWGENRLGRYPWGAHYLPTPGPDAVYVRELLAEMGIFNNGKFSEEALVHEVDERLFIYGQWQSGSLVPQMGAREVDRRDMARFSERMAFFKNLRGGDGRKAFTIPIALSSRDEKILAYDKITAGEFLSRENFTSQRLLWYVDYVLRDEYGSSRANTSAWAMLHYFSARNDSHNLVWPEGNGRVAEYLRLTLGDKIHSAHALRRIDKTTKGYDLYFQDHLANAVRRVHAQKIIFAAPKFILPYVYPALEATKKSAVADFVYSPWLTVNLLVNHFAELEPAWDNVMFGSHSLGYVVAEHQRAGKFQHARTLTFFHAYDADDTLRSRRELYTMSGDNAYRIALAELKKPHDQIESNIEDVGVYRWAHAMIRPRVGFITGRSRIDLAQIDTNFFSAHSDISGMSNFEEAQFQGIEAAKKIIA